VVPPPDPEHVKIRGGGYGLDAELAAQKEVGPTPS
jgi:hypothetical protein